MTDRIPMRTCIGCGQVREKNSMIRIVRTPEGIIRADSTGKTNGRGAYVCPDPACLEKAFRRKALNRAFRCAVRSGDLERVRTELDSIIAERENRHRVSE